jgi:hypothetical protein
MARSGFGTKMMELWWRNLKAMRKESKEVAVAPSHGTQQTHKCLPPEAMISKFGCMFHSKSRTPTMLTFPQMDKRRPTAKILQSVTTFERLTRKEPSRTFILVCIITAQYRGR